MANRLIDESGNRYGLLEVVKRADITASRREAFWECLCNCGESIDVSGAHLRAGTTASCGCLRRLTTAKSFTTHGRSGSSIYSTFSHMNRRCLDKAHKKYAYYGGRGITICDRWHRDTPNSFENFLLDMGEKPSRKHSIDRIDNNGPYTPENCRWSTALEQANNQRSNRRFTYGSRTQNMSQWARELGIRKNTVYQRLYQGWTELQALSLEDRS